MLEGFGGDKRLLLKIVLLQEEWIHYAMRHAAKGDMYCDPADTCNDPLHFLIRCFNTLLRLLLQSVLDNTKIKVKKDKSAKVERVSTMFTNDIYALKNGACANLKITIEDDKVYMPSLSGARLKKITLDYIKNILHLIYSEEDLEDVEQANSYLNWMRLFELFINIDGLLRSHTPLSNYQYVDFLHYKREFSDLFIYMFNYEHIGTYFHNLFSSHITTMLNDNNRCLFKQEQQGVEQKNQRLGTFMNNQTCHGGGKTPTYMCEKILEYCGRQNLRWLNKQRNFSNPESEVSWLDALLNNAGSKNYKYTK